MNLGELFDIVLEFGSPVEAAIETGRGEEMIECFEQTIKEDTKLLEECVREGDDFTAELVGDQIALTRQNIEKIKLVIDPALEI